jgi:stearoyl-CoA desaturase (Delta-9 desaturase)
MTRLSNLITITMFIGLHVIALATIVLMSFGSNTLPFTWTSFWLGFGLYVLRMFAITAGYHRYFAHRSYKTSRWFQFALAVLGCTAMQKGPLWWAGHHRLHHKHSDTELDPHSPIAGTVWDAHVGWILSGKFRRTPTEEIDDFEKYPELRYLECVNWLPGVLLAVLCYWIDGWSGFLLSFVCGTVLLYHATFLVNSACHLWGRRRFATTDQSKNNWWAALLTMGEGWHNNHHHYMSSARQGFKWWELDFSYYILRVLAFFGWSKWFCLVWDIRQPTPKALGHNLIVDEVPVEV